MNFDLEIDGDATTLRTSLRLKPEQAQSLFLLMNTLATMSIKMMGGVDVAILLNACVSACDNLQEVVYITFVIGKKFGVIETEQGIQENNLN